jgi:hypothetical protein
MNDVVTIGIGLVSLIVGACVTLYAVNYQLKQQRKRRVASLSAALAAEIMTLIEIVHHRSYEDELRSVATEAGRIGGLRPTYAFAASQHYFSVFEANAGDIGELDPQRAAEVVAFYQQAKSWLDGMMLVSSEAAKRWPAEDVGARYALLADSLNRLLRVGFEVAIDLVPHSEMRKYIAFAAQRLDPARSDEDTLGR